VRAGGPAANKEVIARNYSREQSRVEFFLGRQRKPPAPLPVSGPAPGGPSGLETKPDKLPAKRVVKAQNYRCQIIVPGFSLTVLVSLRASQKCVGSLRLRSVEGAEAWPAQPDGRGGVRLTLHRKALDLTALRGPGESYSDVILRLAKP
jgi:hypothetical protein